MSRRLVLIRHAKAQGAHPGGDHERELADRGVADAAALGGWLEEEDLLPDQVVVSTAARARTTLSAALTDGDDVEIWEDRRVYDGGVHGIAEAIRETPDEASVLWVVGHEPTMSTLVWDLADEDQLQEDLRDQLSRGFPTGTAAVLTLESAWGDLGSGTCRLVALHTGRGERSVS